MAARADVLLVSARFIREMVRGTAQSTLPVSDDPVFTRLKLWREQHGLTPQPAVVILSASLDLPVEEMCWVLNRQVYIATGMHTDTASLGLFQRSGVKVLHAGDGRYVDGRQLIEFLESEGFSSIYSIAGPGVLETLLRARVLDRIYLTQVHRLLGGISYDTLLEGNVLNPPADFNLQALYYDGRSGDACGQFFSVYDTMRSFRERQSCE